MCLSRKTSRTRPFALRWQMFCESLVTIPAASCPLCCRTSKASYSVPATWEPREPTIPMMPHIGYRAALMKQRLMGFQGRLTSSATLICFSYSSETFGGERWCHSHSVRNFPSVCGRNDGRNVCSGYGWTSASYPCSVCPSTLHYLQRTTRPPAVLLRGLSMRGLHASGG